MQSLANKIRDLLLGGKSKVQVLGETPNQTHRAILLDGHGRVETTGQAFNYEKYGRRVCGVEGRTLYAVENGRLRRSSDCGDTWTDTNLEVSGNHRALVAITTSYVVAWVGLPWKVYTSPIADGLTFTERLADINRPLSRGFDARGDVVNFAEYSHGGTARIWNSQDGGLTWTVAYDATGEVDHFHSLNRISSNWLIATAGDANCYWYLSQDQGLSWERIEASGSQLYRTLGIHVLYEAGRYGHSHTPTRILWATDSTSMSGIYTMKVGEWAYPELLMEHHGLNYGIAGNKAEIMIGMMAPIRTDTLGNTQSGQGYVLVSKDGGNSWQIDMTWMPALGSQGQAGVQEVFGPDIRGNYYITVYSEEGNSQEWEGWIARPTGHYRGNLKTRPLGQWTHKSFFDRREINANATATCSFVGLGSNIQPARNGFRRIKVNVYTDESHSYQVRLRWYSATSTEYNTRYDEFGSLVTDVYLEPANEGNRSGEWVEPKAGVLVVLVSNLSNEPRQYVVELVGET